MASATVPSGTSRRKITAVRASLLVSLVPVTGICEDFRYFGGIPPGGAATSCMLGKDEMQSEIHLMYFRSCFEAIYVYISVDIRYIAEF